ncbi:putative surface protein with fasciclin (FAS1) repeats [Filimonas zeae]|uniref:FAS1 domain-containing protein n=1 Tax=Filimonas zeae TaxID=1737353 RepID=A0A917IVP3_9BACT|nr:fasciclin domain-containing protein [Filimonas zeae]MDR6339046.1 putative surface protein with fasciclin (FAS1) repeats [Filimonas zeae]GGH65359.1 hypothetical protein GCM10011379_18410 [Filimonas zeae]
MKQFLYSVLSAAVAFAAIAGCKNKLAEPPEESLYQTILSQQNRGYSLFVRALERTGQSTLLSNSPSVTAFVPHDSAFERAGFTEAVINSMDTTSLSVLIGYHLVGETVTPANFTAGGRIETRAGYYLYTNRNDGIYVNNIPVSANYLAAANGVMLPLTSVLIPPQKRIYDVITADTTFSIFSAAVFRDSARRILLKDTFNTGSQFTVFAPTNNAFRRIGITDVTIRDTNLIKADSVSRMVRQHYVANATLMSHDFINGNMVKTGLDSTLVLVTATDSRFGASAPAIRAVTRPDTTLYRLKTRDLITVNGILHSIDSLMTRRR